MNINNGFYVSDENQFLAFLTQLSDKQSIKKVVQECNRLGINYLLSMETLDLSHCKLQEIPESIKILKNLKILKLASNKLIDLPKGLVELKNLREIHLENNDFDSFPESLLAIGKTKIPTKEIFYIFLRHNPMEFVPHSISELIVTRPEADTMEDYKL